MTSKDLAQLLTEAVEDVHEIDFAERAWTAAETKRVRSRRRSIASVAAAAAVVVGTVVWLDRGPGGVPAGSPSHAQTAISSTSSASTGTGWDRTPSGVRYKALPLQGTENQLPFTDVGLPEVIDSTRPRVLWSTSTAEQRRTAVAAYLEATNGRTDADTYPTEWRPVLVLRDGTQMTLDTLTVKNTSDSGGNGGTPLGQRAFSSDGMRLAFPQPGTVVIVDLVTGHIANYPVEDPLLEDVGWLSGSAASSLLVSGDRGVWRLDLSQPAPKAVRETDSRATVSAASVQFRMLDPEGARQTVIDRFSNGTNMSTQAATWPMGEPWGAAFASGTSIVSAFFLGTPPDGELSVSAYQGIVTTQDPTTPQQTQLWLLTDGTDATHGRSKGAGRALGWAQSGTKALVAISGKDLTILALDPETGAIGRASTFVPGPTVGGELALGAGFQRE